MIHDRGTAISPRKKNDDEHAVDTNEEEEVRGEVMQGERIGGEEEAQEQDSQEMQESSKVNVMKAPYRPSQKEREDHEVTHCPPEAGVTTASGDKRRTGLTIESKASWRNRA